MQQKKILQPNRANILDHLTFLFGDQNDGLIEIAYTPADSSAVNKADFFKPSEIEKAADFAFNQNSIPGVNVYVGAALRKPTTAPFGRSNHEDYYFSPVLWCDLDDPDAAKKAREKYQDLPPSFVVVTGRKPHLRAQVWWKLQGGQNDKDAQKKALASVCAALDGDKSVVDPIRVMRLGGTIAWPKKAGRVPEQTEIKTPDNATLSVSFDAFQSYFPAPVNPVDKHTPESGGVGLNLRNTNANQNNRDEWSIDQVCDMLGHIHPDGDYLDWVSVGMALKDYGIGFDIWDAWSSKGGKYPGSQELRKKWDSFKGAGVSIGSVYFFAHQNGYHPSKYQKTSLPPASFKTEIVNEKTGEVTVYEGKPETKGLYYINAPDISMQLDSRDFVQGLLSESALSVVYGESNCGKTFFMTDLAFHIVEGKNWYDKRVEKGNVLYVCLEGAFGLKNRIAAYKKKTGATLSGFLMMPCAVDFVSENTNVPELIDLVNQAKQELGEIKLVVIDTLARAIGGGDENSGQDMSTLVSNADLIRALTNAHVCFVHHSGKDKARGARGHSSLRAAVDTEIEVSRQEGADYSDVKIAKQRDMEIIEPFQFKLERVVLGKNRHGEDVSSCVVEPYDMAKDLTERVQKKIKSGKTKTAFDALLECISEKGSVKHNPDIPKIPVITEKQFKEYLAMRGLLSDNNKSAGIQYRRIIDGLIENKLVVIRGEYLWTDAQ